MALDDAEIVTPSLMRCDIYKHVNRTHSIEEVVASAIIVRQSHHTMIVDGNIWASDKVCDSQMSSGQHGSAGSIACSTLPC